MGIAEDIWYYREKNQGALFSGDPRIATVAG